MALCNQKEDKPRIMETNLKNLAKKPSNLCKTLDYLLSVSETDAINYWEAVLRKARKLSSEAYVLMIPGIINILPKLGIPHITSLFNVGDDRRFRFRTTLKSIVEAYALEDINFKNYNVVHHANPIKSKLNGNRRVYFCSGTKKFSSSNMIKTLLGHLGLDVKCSLVTKKKSKEHNWTCKSEYNITISSCSQLFAILSCIYDYNHWGNFLNMYESLRCFDIGQYKSDIVDKFLCKNVEMEQGESLGSQDTLLGGPSSSQNSTTQSSSMVMEDMDGIEEFFEE